MYTIDAWLERKNPILRVFHVPSGLELIRWSGDTLRDMLEQGDLQLQDLQDHSLSLSERLGLTKDWPR
jgi:hypothetical protein